jgi:hypothetical protein
MEDERNVEAALFLELSDDENSIEIVSSPRLLTKVGPQRNMVSPSIRSSEMIPDMDVKFKSMPSSSFSDLSLPTHLNHLERFKKLQEAADAPIDAEFAELDAWLQSGSNEIV